jgi:hypothetical protein
LYGDDEVWAIFCDDSPAEAFFSVEWVFGSCIGEPLEELWRVDLWRIGGIELSLGEEGELSVASLVLELDEHGR